MSKNIILIHGLRGSSYGLREIADSKIWEGKYNIFTPNIPPAGAKTLRSYEPKDFARFIADYIKDNKIEKPILVGHSMGSIISAAVAERYPDLIAQKIVFLAPISQRPPRFISNLSPLLTFASNHFLSWLTTRYLFIPRHNRALYRKTMAFSYLCGAEYSQKLDAFKAARFASKYCIADFEFDKKTCFIIGEKDRVVSAKVTKRIFQKTATKISIVKDSGHLLNFEHPDETAKAIKEFIENKKI